MAIQNIQSVYMNKRNLIDKYNETNLMLAMRALLMMDYSHLMQHLNIKIRDIKIFKYNFELFLANCRSIHFETEIYLYGATCLYN